MQRPKLLAAGLTAWSLLTIVESQAKDFSGLLLARVGFAAAQAAQNPVCFSLSESQAVYGIDNALHVCFTGVQDWGGASWSSPCQPSVVLMFAML